MNKLVKYLSPFAPDQSGACGVLYEFGGIVVICDAGGCAGNICGFDEPRWFTHKSAVFSAGLRDMDAILGRDDKLVAKLAKAHEQLNAEFTAIIGTPVPAVIATDHKALKRMSEKKTGVPCIAAECTGTHYYDVGEQKVWAELFREFAVERYDKKSGRVGVIGATPLETSMMTSDHIVSECHSMGITEPIVYGMGFGLDYVREASKAEKNLVVSLAAIPAAEYLKEKFGTPYEVSFPFLPERVVRRVQTMNGKKVLIIHTQLIANALRDNMRGCDVTNCTWFGQNAALKQDVDFVIRNEEMLAETVKNSGYDVIIADGAVKRLLDSVGFSGEFVDFPHFAVSGELWDNGESYED